MTNNFNEKIAMLQAMGYDPIVSRNALEAADGDVEAAVEIILADESNSSPSAAATRDHVPAEGFDTSSTPTAAASYEGKTAKEVISTWSKQVLGDKHPEAKARVKQAGKTMKEAWSSAVTKWNEFDEKNQISTGAKDAINSADRKMKEFDEKHQWSKKTNDAAVKGATAFKSGVDNAKRSLAT